MNGVRAAGGLGGIQQVRGEDGIHVDGTRQSFDVSEEAHATECAVCLRHESAVEAHHNRDAVHHSLEGRHVWIL